MSVSGGNADLDTYLAYARGIVRGTIHVNVDQVMDVTEEFHNRSELAKYATLRMQLRAHVRQLIAVMKRKLETVKGHPGHSEGEQYIKDVERRFRMLKVGPSREDQMQGLLSQELRRHPILGSGFFLYRKNREKKA